MARLDVVLTPAPPHSLSFEIQATGQHQRQVIQQTGTPQQNPDYLRTPLAAALPTSILATASKGGLTNGM